MSSNFGTPSTSFGAPSTGTSSTTSQQTNGAVQAAGAIQPNAVAGAQANLPSDAPQEIIDPNDPRLVSENIDVNTAGDAYAQPAPPPDGRYRAKLKLEGVKNDKQELVPYLPKMTKKPPIVPYFFTAISAHIIDPSGKYDDIPVFDSWVGTFVNKDGSTKVSTILSKLKRPDGRPWIQQGQKMNQKDWMEMFIRALAGEPEIVVETQWEWSCQQCGEEAKAAGRAYPKSVVGMQKFPPQTDAAKLKAGEKFQPEMKCQVNPAHGYSRARVTVGRFLSLAEAGIKG